MADTYNSTNINEWNASTPADTDSIGDVGKAIRQIKKTIMTTDVSDVNGLTSYLKGTLEEFIVDKITERFKHFYRVGDIICTQNKNNPSEVFGGTWEPLEHGAFLRAEQAPVEESEYLTTTVVRSQYNYVKASGSSLNDLGNPNNVLYDFDYSNYEKYLVKSPEKGYWLYTKDRWSEAQNESVAVDYIPVYMWKKVSDEDNI